MCALVYWYMCVLVLRCTCIDVCFSICMKCMCIGIYVFRYLCALEYMYECMSIGICVQVYLNVYVLVYCMCACVAYIYCLRWRSLNKQTNTVFR